MELVLDLVYTVLERVAPHVTQLGLDQRLLRVLHADELRLCVFLHPEIARSHCLVVAHATDQFNELVFLLLAFLVLLDEVRLLFGIEVEIPDLRFVNVYVSGLAPETQLFAARVLLDLTLVDLFVILFVLLLRLAVVFLVLVLFFMFLLDDSVVAHETA